MSSAKEKTETGKSSVWNDGTTNVPKDVREGAGVEDGDRLHWQLDGEGEMHVWVESEDH